jgi:hypothetical protein
MKILLEDKRISEYFIENLEDYLEDYIVKDDTGKLNFFKMLFKKEMNLYMDSFLRKSIQINNFELFMWLLERMNEDAEPEDFKDQLIDTIRSEENLIPNAKVWEDLFRSNKYVVFREEDESGDDD